MKIRERYAKVNPKTLENLDINSHISNILEFSRDEDTQQVLQKIEGLDINHERVWLLCGSDDKANWDCLQVAQTKDKIVSEIYEDISFMLENNYFEMIDSSSAENQIRMNTEFYEDAYVYVANDESKKNDKRKYMYSKMKEDYKYSRVYVLDVDNYLGIADMSYGNDDVMNILSIAKYLYEEAKIAYDLQARYWNKFNSGVDGQAIMWFLGEQRNQNK